MKSIAVLCFLAILFAQCNTSKITNTWRAPLNPQKEYSRILVLGLINEKDHSVREKMENHFVNDLKDIGYTAISSFKEYGPKAFDNMEEESAVSKMKNGGFDAIITIVLLNKEKENKYIPSNSSYPVAGPYSNRFWDYQTAINQRIYQPGYFVTDTKYLWETNFYDVATQKLVYSAQTKTFDPANTESMGHDYGLMIVKNMVKQKVLPDLTAAKFE